jgi:hypothetical protein
MPGLGVGVGVGTGVGERVALVEAGVELPHAAVTRSAPRHTGSANRMTYSLRINNPQFAISGSKDHEVPAAIWENVWLPVLEVLTAL